MTTTPDELMRDAFEQEHGYDVEVLCDCGEAWTVRFFDGEPRDENLMTCDRCEQRGVVQ